MNWLNPPLWAKSDFYSPTSIEQPYQDRIQELQILVKLSFDLLSLWLQVHFKNYLSYFSTKTYVVGTQKNHLIEYQKQIFIEYQKTNVRTRDKKIFPTLCLKVFVYLSGPMYYPKIGLVKEKIWL